MLQGYRTEDNHRVDTFREECNIAVLAAKEEYLRGLGKKLANPSTSQKVYWKVLNRLIQGTQHSTS